MIEKLLPLQFIKKSPFYGSCQGMRYRLRRQEEELEVCIYPEPFAFDATPEEKKRYFTFAFSEEGYEEALALLNREYEAGTWPISPLQNDGDIV
ncbi:MAG TPA: GNAT family acetyltransferase [Firmicutes bacterium]|nr:GNAT family acetyltransferase [Bacillota bacterium]